MRVLVACEESQEVCKAFRALGYEAYSCDIEPCSGGHPEWHLRCDALELLKMRWDMILAFPPMYIPVQRRGQTPVQRGRSQSGTIPEGTGSKGVFLEVSERRLPSYLCRKSGIQQDLRDANAYSGGPALDVRAPGTEENPPMAERTASAGTD